MTIIIRYAAYGSNLHPVRLTERLPAARFKGPAFLPGYALSFTKRSEDGSGKCTIGLGGDGVHLAVYEISARDKERLDEIEGVGAGYEAIDVDVPGIGTCATYIAASSHVDPDLCPYDWYRELVLLGCRYHGFPDEYVRRIAALAFAADGDVARSELNHGLVRRIRGQ